MNNLEIAEIIVVVRVDQKFRWFKSDRELWVLDLRKWRMDFLDAGYEVPDPDLSERFGIPVVNERTATHFLAEMRQF